MSDYAAFIDRKSQSNEMSGFDPIWMPDFLFDFQRSLVDWALRKGKALLAEDCGLGKTPQFLVWGENVVRKTNKPVLVLTPLAVSFQTILEAAKFDIEAHRSSDGKVYPGINVTNYERLHYFNPDDFAGVICDESSILKNFDGAYKSAITEFMRKVQYRLCDTATAAPNDYIELGTTSETLGELGYMDMLSRFFKNDQGNTIKARRVFHDAGKNWAQLDDAAKWRLKGHAEVPFWRWVCSWARAIRKPSDLGFDDTKFILPPLIEKEYLVTAQTLAPGMLFPLPAVGLKEQREERRRTVTERCEKVASLVAEKVNEPSLVWCHLNAEGDLLEAMIPRAIQVQGSDSNEWKESAAMWFVGSKCICNDPLFRVKLSAWKRENAETQNTCASTTRPTKANGKGTAPLETESTLGAENGTPMTQKSDREKSQKSKRIEKNIQKRDYSDCLNDITSPSINTENSLRSDVLFAGAKQMSISEGSNDSTSTIVIPQENSEDYCARLAISALESSGMIHLGLSEPQCICGYSSGKRVLISKPVMFGFGLNFQHCAHVTFFPSHSYEQYYQGVRRCWRFGQTKPVKVDIVTTEGEQSVLKNLQRKSLQADKMFSALVKHMNNSEKIARSIPFTKLVEVPVWL